MDQHRPPQDFSGETFQPSINAVLLQMQIQALHESLRRLSRTDDINLPNLPKLEGDGDSIRPTC